jgi:hypothetical protein
MADKYYMLKGQIFLPDRIFAKHNGARVQLFSRNLKDATGKFPAVARWASNAYPLRLTRS